MKAKTDRFDNIIGDGSYHVEYDVIDFSLLGYDMIESQVIKSNTSESVYVYYKNTQNDKVAVVRFSWHTSNSVVFDDVLTFSDTEEILYRLGLMRKTFIPDTRLFITTQQIKKVDVNNYEEATLTIQDMYKLGENADLSEYVGKLAKGSRYLILSPTIKKFELTTGQYNYEKI